MILAAAAAAACSYQGYQHSACTTVQSMLDLPTRTRRNPRRRNPNDRSRSSIRHRSLNSRNSLSSSRDQRYQSMFTINHHPRKMGTSLRYGSCNKTIWESEPGTKRGFFGLEQPEKCLRSHLHSGRRRLRKIEGFCNP